MSFVDSEKTGARSAAKFGTTIPSSFLNIMCNCVFLHCKVRSPIQLEWPDFTSPSCSFETASDFRARVGNRAFWKLQDVISPLKTTTCVSKIVYIADLRSRQFIDLPVPIISQCNGGVSGGSFLSQILVAMTDSTMGDISYTHLALPRCKFCYVTAVRSCNVIKGHHNFLTNSFG